MILEKITRSEKECPVKAFFAVGMIFVLLLSVSPIQAQSSQAQQAPASVASDLVARITKVKGRRIFPAKLPLAFRATAPSKFRMPTG
jgi:hypothetical protein